MARFISIISGKGDEGKTSLALNLALALASKGRRPLLICEDPRPGECGLPAETIAFGLEQIIGSNRKAFEMVQKAAPGVDMLPVVIEGANTADLRGADGVVLGQALAEAGGYDFFILDMAAETMHAMVAGCRPAPEILLVATPKSKSLTTSYEILKILYLNGFRKKVSFLVNQSTNPKRTQDAYRKLRDPVAKYLKLELEFLGLVPLDPEFQTAAQKGDPLGILFPTTPGYKAIVAVAEKLIGSTKAIDLPNPGLFFEKLVVTLKGPLKLTNGNAKEGSSMQKKGVAKILDRTDRPSAYGLMGGGETGTLLHILTENMAAISRELAGIRKILEEKGVAMAPQLGSDVLGDTNGDEITRLDFEAFSAEKKSAGESEDG
jgi:flagellar biosynthesis protein FlhG